MHAPFNVYSHPDLQVSDLTHRHGDALVLAGFGLVCLLLTGLFVHLGAGRDQDSGGGPIAGISDTLREMPAVVLP
jgi:hypothetical protein